MTDVLNKPAEVHRGSARGLPALPDRMIEPLRVVAARAKILAWLRAMLQVCALIAAVWLGMVLVLGWRVQVPLWIAIPLIAAGWLAVLYGTFRIFRRLFRRRRDLAAAARLVDVAVPDTQERLSSAIEISQEKEAAFRGSPELVACLIRQAEHHAENLDPGKVISGKEVMRWLTAAGAMLLVWFVVFVVLTPNVLLGLQRIFNPWTVAAPLPAPVIVVAPGDAMLAQGDKLEITVEIKPPEGISLDNGISEIAGAQLSRHFDGGATSPELISDMEKTDARKFHLYFDRVQQSFTYKVIVDNKGKNGIGRGESPNYTVTVNTRPAVADVEVQYTFPAYTRQAPRVDHSHDGTLDALTGTKAHVTIHTTEAVKTATLKLDDDGAGVPRELTLAPVQSTAAGNGAGAAAYAADLTILRNTQYHVHLVKPNGQENLDDTGRPIFARPDNAPAIGITSPDPKAAPLKVRPDDHVPIQYVATDDYGITRIEAMLDVDGTPAATMNVPFTHDDADTQITGEWQLDLKDLLKSPAAAANAKKVGYQLRVTDNRAPGPQTATSTRQYLDLSSDATPLAQRMDTEAAKELTSAIKDAANKLRSAEDQLKGIQDRDLAESLKPGDQKHLSDTQQAIGDARRELASAADKANGTRLSDMGRMARGVADQEVRKAQEESTKAGLATDQPGPRRTSEADAAKDTQDAIDRLDRIAQAVAEAAKRQPLAQSLERLSQKEQQLAEALAKNPNDPQLLEQQKQLQQDLDKLVKDNPDLQKPAEEANRQQVSDLVKKIQRLETQQQPISDQLNSVNDAQHAGDRAKELAKDQQNLNTKIKQFTQQQAGKSPDSAKLDGVVKELNDNRPDDAARDQKSTATTLEQMQKNLETEENRANNTPDQTQRAANAAQQAKSLADAERDLAQQSADLSRQEHDAAAAKQNAGVTADQQKQLADGMNEAARDAQKLEQQMQGSAPSLSQKAHDASQALRDAAQSQQDAANATRNQDANGAAQRQEKSADQLASAEQALTGQRRPSSGKPQNGRASKGSAQNAADQNPKNAATQATDPRSADGSQSAGSQDDPPAGMDPAKSVQDARNSQAQAARGDSTAARKAADQLSQAAQQLMNGNSQAIGQNQTANGSGKSQGNGQQGAQANRQGSGQNSGQGAGMENSGSGAGQGQPGPGQGQGAAGGQASGTGSTPGAGAGSNSSNGGSGTVGSGGGGMQLSQNGRPLEAPKEVQEAGVSPSDWARLPPDMQQQLIHAAQQPGPPAYREMIKNYYSRIARLQGDPAAQEKAP